MTGRSLEQVSASLLKLKHLSVLNPGVGLGVGVWGVIFLFFKRRRKKKAMRIQHSSHFQHNTHSLCLSLSFSELYTEAPSSWLGHCFQYSTGIPFEAITELTTHQLSLIAH